MSYSSKKNLVSIIAGILLTIAYSIYALGGKAPVAGDLQSWAVAMLVFIGISIAALVVIQVLFHIGLAIGIAVKENGHDEKKVERILESSMVEDEREKLIGLKASHIGGIIAGIGFVAALVTLAVGLSAVFALHIVFGAFAIGSIIEGCVSIYHHERGVQNG